MKFNGWVFVMFTNVSPKGKLTTVKRCIASCPVCGQKKNKVYSDKAFAQPCARCRGAKSVVVGAKFSTLNVLENNLKRFDKESYSYHWFAKVLCTKCENTMVLNYQTLRKEVCPICTHIDRLNKDIYRKVE
jgi:rubrerythrin